MIFEALSSAEAIGYSSMRMIECAGLDKSSADMHLGPTRAHFTLDTSPGQTRFLRRLDFSNSLLVAKVDKIVNNNNNYTGSSNENQEAGTALDFSSQLEKPEKNSNNNNNNNNNEEKQKITALQRCRGLFETDVIRAPTEIIEAVLRPSSLTLDELDGTKKFPLSNLVKLSALFNVCFMSRQALIQYLISRAAIFFPVVENENNNNSEDIAEENEQDRDFYVRFLDPSLLREGVLEISSFLRTLEEFYNEETEMQEAENEEISNEEKTSDLAAEDEKGKNEEKHLNVNILERKVREHFLSSQFPIIYEISWQYMTISRKITNDSPVATSFHLARVVPLIGTHLISKSGALTKQSLAELWEACTSEYWFLNAKHYYSSSSTSNINAFWSGEAHLYGYFAKTELKGVILAPHTRMPLQVVPRIIHLFKMSSKWEKNELLAFLNPIAESQKILATTLGRRCREVKDGKNIWCYLI